MEGLGLSPRTPVETGNMQHQSKDSQMHKPRSTLSIRTRTLDPSFSCTDRFSQQTGWQENCLAFSLLNNPRLLRSLLSQYDRLTGIQGLTQWLLIALLQLFLICCRF